MIKRKLQTVLIYNKLIVFMRYINFYPLLGCFIFALATIFIGCGTSSKSTTVLISTPYGDMKAILYEDTPIHRNNFLKLASEGFYDGTLFHRCIPGFMIQGGDPESKDAAQGQLLGGGDPGYTIEAEMGKIHKRGALSAARTGDAINPQRRSSGSQFFIVTGEVIESQILDYFSNQTGRVYSQEERQLYQTIGGRPDLDMNYSVFGEIIEGFEVLDKISALPTDPNNRPIDDVPMKVKVLHGKISQ
jgi:cyclophilin family peptidyl-prolyl cis-trans isomerase